MSYESVDTLLKLLAEDVFPYTIDRKKATGRVLGTFREIITYCPIKTLRLEHFAAIAQQGSYGARTGSALQRIRKADGSWAEFLQKSDTGFIVSDYYASLSPVIDSDDGYLPRNFILTVDVVSNHGNWFTSDTPNNELKVLAQSYDWHLFLTDKGISEFLTDLLVDPIPEYAAVKAAFRKSYSAEKKGNVFMKVKIEYESDAALCSYFSKNLKRIEGWFNVSSPKGTSLKEMKRDLSVLAAKDWESVYGSL